MEKVKNLAYMNMKKAKEIHKVIMNNKQILTKNITEAEDLMSRFMAL